MRIRFNEIDTTSIEHFYGGEGSIEAKMIVDKDGNRILKGSLSPGSTVGLHRHENSMEVIFILSGTGKAICDDTEEILAPGDCHYCPDGSRHCLVNDSETDLVFYAVVPKLG